MLDPLPTYAMQLIISGQSPDLVNDLLSALRGPLAWTSIPVGEVQNTRMWETTSGDWRFILVDFSVETQPGHKPGDRGQNVTMSNRKHALHIMSDGTMQHEVARWLLAKLEAAELVKRMEDAGMVRRADESGSGKTGMAWRN